MLGRRLRIVEGRGRRSDVGLGGSGPDLEASERSRVRRDDYVAPPRVGACMEIPSRTESPLSSTRGHASTTSTMDGQHAEDDDDWYDRRALEIESARALELKVNTLTLRNADLSHEASSEAALARDLRTEMASMKLALERTSLTRCSERDQLSECVLSENRELQELERLRRENQELHRKNSSLQQEVDLLREEAERRVENKKYLEDQLAGAQANCASLAAAKARELSEAQTEITRLKSEVHDLVATIQSLPSENRLRAAMLSQTTTLEDMRQAIRGSEGILEEAKRELHQKEIRARRAAFEELAVAVEKDDEALIEAALTEARRVGMDEDELEKAEKKLNDLRSMTDEQKAKKRRAKAEVQWKKDAFPLVKKDDASALRALLDGLEADVRWMDWRDYAGRTMWKCAQELKSLRVQRYLAPLLGMPVPEDSSEAQHRKPSVRLPATSQPEADDRNDDSSLRPRNSRPSLTKEDRPRPPTVVSDESIAERERRRSTVKSLLNDPELIAMVDGAKGQVQRASFGAAEEELQNCATPEKCFSRQASPVGEVEHCLPGAAQEAILKPPPESSKVDAPPELVAQLRTQAFRCVVQSDCETLISILESIDKQVWSSWENKAGKDLLTLAQERGSNEAYSVIAKQLGLLKETQKASFEEREAVWVYAAGEVQPRRATVIEDSPPDADEVLLEYWDGDDPPSFVDKSMIRKCG